MFQLSQKRMLYVKLCYNNNGVVFSLTKTTGKRGKVYNL